MSKVLVIGDIIIDRYIHGTASRLSPEAPIPVINQTTTHDRLGGAGNVYENLKSIGVDADLFDNSVKKSVKTRIFCDGHYVSRIDDDVISDGDVVLEKLLSTDFSQYEYVVLSDYNKGTLSKSKQIIEHINKYDCKVIVDPKRKAEHYTGAWLVKPNQLEELTYQFKSHFSNYIITDASSTVYANIEGNLYSKDPAPVEVNDVTGAGDCFLAAFVYGLVNKFDYHRSLSIAVEAATESVKHTGTYVLSFSDLKDSTVFTNGVFDILHIGHLELLKAAKNSGSRLVVGINSDASVKRLKGNSRPINNQQLRKAQLESLPWVDNVHVFDEDTPYSLIERIKPSLIVKGGDYAVSEVVGNDLAKVMIFPTIDGVSTTNIIEASK